MRYIALLNLVIFILAIFITYVIAKKEQKELYDYVILLFIVIIAVRLTMIQKENFVEYSREPHNYRPYRDNPNEKDRICNYLASYQSGDNIKRKVICK